jgi:hypothetical protein
MLAINVKFSCLFSLFLVLTLLIASLQVDRREGNGDKHVVQVEGQHVAKYVLDSSVASLVLDGELWGRCPSSLVGHKKDMQAALFGSDERIKLSELAQTTNYIPRAINAYSWAKGVVERADTDVLFILDRRS